MLRDKRYPYHGAKCHMGNRCAWQLRKNISQGEFFTRQIKDNDMGETLARVSVGYRKYKKVLRIIGAVIGILVGIAGCIAFGVIYHNYNAASWAGVSAIFASIFLYFNVAVYRDVDGLFSETKFTIFVNIGMSGMFAGIIAFITNIAFGIAHHETGVVITGNFIVCVWNFMTFKWGLFTFLAARKYRKVYFEADSENRYLTESA